jgi:hypothetical protein
VLRNEGLDGVRRAGGPLGYVHWKPLTWLWEADWSELDNDTGDPPMTFFTSHELSVVLRQGLELKGTFDLYDPEMDDDSGRQIRYGIGAESMVYPFVRLEAMMYLYKPEAGSGFNEPEYSQFAAQVHFCY